MQRCREGARSSHAARSLGTRPRPSTRRSAGPARCRMRDKTGGRGRALPKPVTTVARGPKEGTRAPLPPQAPQPLRPKPVATAARGPKEGSRALLLPQAPQPPKHLIARAAVPQVETPARMAHSHHGVLSRHGHHEVRGHLEAAGRLWTPKPRKWSARQRTPKSTAALPRSSGSQLARCAHTFATKSAAGHVCSN